jgi:hypothetical protein
LSLGPRGPDKVCNRMIFSERERQAAQAKLKEVRAAQTAAFWDALLELEELTGLELCSDVDYEDHELDALEEAAEDVQHGQTGAIRCYGGE